MYWRVLSTILSILLFAITQTLLMAQELKDPGRPYIQNFDYKTYQAHQENWSIVQDQRGVIYVGNNLGILEYDGISWRTITTDKNVAALSLDIDKDGIVWVGLESEMGFLAPDAAGQMQFVSVVERLPEDQREFSQVWKVHATSEGVYFLTIKKLFLWNGDSMQVEDIVISSLSTEARDVMYFVEYEKGIVRVEDCKTHVVPGTESIKNEENQILLPYGKSDSLLVVTKNGGLFLYDGNSVAAFDAPVNEWLKQNFPYSAIQLRNGNYVIGTIRGGALVINSAGERLMLLDRNAGLRDQTIVFPYEDNEGSVWLAMTNGLARFEPQMPFMRYDAANGIESAVFDIKRHNRIIYAGTQLGAFYLDPLAETTPEGLSKAFKPIKEITTYTYVLQEEDGILLAGTDRGVYEITDRKARRVEARWPRVYDFHRGVKHPERVYVALLNGISIMLKEDGHWEHYRRIQKVDEEIIALAGDENDVLWLGTPSNGVLRVEVEPPTEANDNFYVALSKRYGEEHGLPSGRIEPENIGERIVFSTAEGVFEFNAVAERFEPTLGFDQAQENARAVADAAYGADSTIWITGNADWGIFTKVIFPEGEEHIPSLYRLVDLGQISVVYPENNNELIWFGGAEGITAYKRTEDQLPVTAFSTLIRRVIVDGDSVLYHGSGPAPKAPLSYEDNALRFEYSATSFYGPEQLAFRYKLEGFDSDWSAWTNESRKDYTNIPEGSYTFRVQAVDLFVNSSKDTGFEVRILPPWYRSWWAYLLYGLAVLAGLFLFTRSQVNKNQRRAEETLQREKERARLQEATLRAENAEAQKEIEKEQIRSRIASDLHDEIGSNLSSISVISQMLQKKQQIGDKERDRLTRIQGISQQTANSMRDIVWFVNPVNDRLDRLFAKMRETANTMLEAHDFQFNLQDYDWTRETDLNFRRNLFLVYKEALQNVVKHSQATTVNIDISTDDANFFLFIRDNGRGFQSAVESTGSGMSNFQKRAAEVGGTISVDSEKGKGTVVALSVPMDKILTEKKIP